jgi:hypothetical protein
MFIKFGENENILLLELAKLCGDGIKMAGNVCDLDGDGLFDIALKPKGGQERDRE